MDPLSSNENLRCYLAITTRTMTKNVLPIRVEVILEDDVAQ